jgi:hypothetical protein
MKESEPKKIDSQEYIEKNMRKIKIEGSNISIGEDQSALINDSSVYLLGKIEQGKVGVFETMSNDRAYIISSGVYFSCAEITGEVGPDKFLIHALDGLSLKNHLLSIREVANNQMFSEIVLRLDDERGNRNEYRVALEKILGNEIEIENKTFLDS